MNNEYEVYNRWKENQAWKHNETFFNRWEAVILIFLSFGIATIIARIIGII